MKIIFIFLLMILIIVFYKSPALGSLLEFNPFKNQINLRNTSVERFLGEGLELNNETNSDNPLEMKSNFKKKPKYRNLVIVTVGNSKGNLDKNLLLNRNLRNFDIMIVFSGSAASQVMKYKHLTEHLYIHKGSKFQNLHFVYNNHRDVLDKYDRFFALDNTIIIDTESINKMFDISERYKLMICAPTFKYDATTAAQHKIMLSINQPTLRYVNFIECSVPLLNRHALDKLMNYYDPALMDNGIDYLYIWACGESVTDKYALVDNVSCSKAGRSSGGRSSDIWSNFAKKWGIKYGKENHRVWKTIPLK
jgi:hypothetical protein